MIDPRLWASLPFNNKTALLDFAGTHYLFHVAVAQQVFAVTGVTYRLPPIGDPAGGSAEWLLAVQSTYQNASRALGIPGPPDMASYNLADRNDFASWCFILSGQARILRTAAGMV